MLCEYAWASIDSLETDWDGADYAFVLDQIGKNAVLNLSMIDQDISYGIFDLKGSGVAIKSLSSACRQQAVNAPARIEAPEGVVYCGSGTIKRQIEYRILGKPEDEWDARVTVNGESIRAMTSYSYFGSATSMTLKRDLDIFFLLWFAS